MIDPHRITDFDRSDAELEEFAIFAPATAGKDSKVAASKTALFLDAMRRRFTDEDIETRGLETPLDFVRELDRFDCLGYALEEVKMGKYTLLEQCYRILGAKTRDRADFLRTATPAELQTIPGWGRKTARFFVLHSRRDARVACLDTHVIRHLNENGIPASVPTNEAAYLQLERHVLRLADRAGMSPADYDLHVWNTYARPQ